jgi:hypothetical protein
MAGRVLSQDIIIAPSGKCKGTTLSLLTMHGCWGVPGVSIETYAVNNFELLVGPTTLGGNE